MKLGKRVARTDSVKFKLKDFINPSVLPKLPPSFGHEKFIASNAWGMLANDKVGDCVFAGAAHETKLWNASANKNVYFNNKSVLSDYSALTGYNGSEESDQGTDMQEAASYRRKTGIIDSSGVRHKIEAYLAIEPGNLLEHKIALYFFEAVGIGLDLPSSAIDQFEAGKLWSYVSKSHSVGGHYVPLVACRDHLACVTWGKVQPMTNSFFVNKNDESVAYVSTEMLTKRKSPEGFDYDGLMKCLAQLK